jgi:hypothetical protein
VSPVISIPLVGIVLNKDATVHKAQGSDFETVILIVPRKAQTLRASSCTQASRASSASWYR